jgi:hypothetical protein
MAIKILRQDTTDLATGADWWTASNAPVFGASAVTSTVGGNFSDTFTAPSTSDSCVGVLFYLTSTNGGQLEITLQEGGVDTVCTMTTGVLNTATDSGWVFFLFPTPYTYTTTVANSYRFKFVRVGATVTVRYSTTSTSTVFAYAVDDRSGIASNDKIFIVGDQTNTKTVTIASSFTFGDGVTTGSTNSDRTTANGIQIGRRGRVIFDPSADITLTCSATISNGEGGSFVMDSSTNSHKIIFNQTATSQMKLHGVTTSTEFILRGIDRVGHGVFSSGLGTAASPLIIASARPDWVVGDEIVLYAVSDNSANYNEAEKRFIITKNSDTSYVLSNTSGGSENALAHSHTNGDIINLNRSCVITTNNASYGVSVSISTVGTVANARFLYPTGLVISCGASNIVSDRPLTGGLSTTGARNKTYRYCYIYGIATAGSSDSLIFATSRQLLVEDIYMVDSAQYLVVLQATYNSTFRRLKLNSSKASSGYALRIINSRGNFMTDLDVNCIRGSVFLFSSGRDNYISGRFGKKGKYGSAQINTSSDDTEVTITNSEAFDWSIATTANLPDGAFIRVENEDLIANKDYWYTNYHTFTRTGTGLADTTTRLGSGFALRYEQRTASQEGAYTFEVPAMGIANKAMAVSVWVKINSANFYSGTYTLPTLRLTYDGSITEETVATATTDWQKITVAITPTVNDQLIKANLYMETDQTGSSSYVYIEDISAFYPPDSIQNFGTLNSWADGMPLTPPISSAVSAQDVWAVPSNTSFGTGTMGKQAVDTKKDTNLIKVVSL